MNVRGGNMNIREISRQKARERYLDNEYVLERIDREINFFDETGMIEEIETFIEIRDIIVENIFLNQS